MENVENENKKRVCADCGAEIGNDEEVYTLENGKIICEGCFNDDYYMCEHCGKIEHIDNSIIIDYMYYCNDCVDALGFVQCEDCGEWYDPNYSGIYVENHGNVCEQCSSDYYYCEHCGNYYRDNQMIFNDYDEPICRNCYDEEANRAGFSLQNYGYKPKLEIFKTGTEKENKLYIGFENETERGSYEAAGRNELCRIIGEKVNKDNIFCYFKSDGSLNDGVEIVSHAFSYEYMRKNEKIFKDILETAAANGYKSHDTNTCGLHVHINKAFFGITQEEQDQNIDKMILFFECYKKEIEIFSRRNDYGYCKFLSDATGTCNRKKACSIEYIKSKKNSVSRYAAINLENDHTVEIRIFRGTLKPDTFFAALEFVFALAQVVKNNPINKISWKKVINYKGMKYLKTYCIEKNIYITENTYKDFSIELLKERAAAEKALAKNIKEIVIFSKKLSKQIWREIKELQIKISSKNINFNFNSNTYDFRKKTELYSRLAELLAAKNSFTALDENTCSYYIRQLNYIRSVFDCLDATEENALYRDTFRNYDTKLNDIFNKLN